MDICHWKVQNSRYYEKPWTAEEKTLSAFDQLEQNKNGIITSV